jgi:hypothetical protein
VQGVTPQALGLRQELPPWIGNELQAFKAPGFTADPELQCLQQSRACGATPTARYTFNNR